MASESYGSARCNCVKTRSADRNHNPNSSLGVTLEPSSFNALNELLHADQATVELHQSPWYMQNTRHPTPNSCLDIHNTSSLLWQARPPGRLSCCRGRPGSSAQARGQRPASHQPGPDLPGRPQPLTVFGHLGKEPRRKRERNRTSEAPNSSSTSRGPCQDHQWLLSGCFSIIALRHRSRRT